MSADNNSEYFTESMATFETATHSTRVEIVPVTLQWTDISVTATKGHRELLKDVNGIAKPGELMALMGASGAGKTTLLNILMNRNLKGLETRGNITVNGVEMGDKISYISGFAQQEEMFIPTLTVQEHLMIQAKLRIKGGSEIRKHKVEEVLNQLKLTKCRDSKIGSIGHEKGISGGEARRLTFASELLSNPSLLFADEPTTGLDSFMAENVIQILKGIAKLGRTIICTIHQPSSQLYQMFDRVIYLSAGHVAFYGSPKQSIAFFDKCGHRVPEEYNPSEWIIYKLAVQPGQEIEANTRIGQIVSKFEKSEYNHRLMEDLEIIGDNTSPPFMYTANPCVQFQALFKRCTLDVWRCPQLTAAKIVQKIIFGLFLAALYFQTAYDKKGILNINGALFFLSAELFFSTCFAIMMFMNNEFSLVAREIHDGLYNLSTYYVARCLSLVPLFSTDGLIFLYIMYWAIGFNSTVVQVIVASCITLLTSQAASALGIGMSCIFPTATMTAVMACPVLVLFRTFSGFYGNLSSFPSFVRWLQYISPFRYGFEGFIVNQWSEIDSFHSDVKANWTKQHRDNILEYYSFSSNALPWDFIGLTVFTLICYIIGFLALAIRIKRAR